MNSHTTNASEDQSMGTTPKMLEHVRFNFPTKSGNYKKPTYAGEVVFVIGPNGSGKSSLLQKLYADNLKHAIRISAHRQTWFDQNAGDMTLRQKRSMDANISNADAEGSSRWEESYASERINVALFGLIDLDNAHARKARNALLSRDEMEQKKIKQEPAPFSRLNNLLKMGNLPINISIGDNQQLFASKNNSQPYSIAEMSDGERNAVLLAAAILTAPSKTLIIIDEPERHLHRSIASPLLVALFAERNDCAFVISTHDVSLPMDIPQSTTLLLRSCTWEGQSGIEWDSDIVDADLDNINDIKRAILGSRRKILFVEGDPNSTDRHTYSILYPDISVSPCGNCTEVERAVTGIRNSGHLHWVTAYGLIDRDNRPPEEVEQLAEQAIFALDCYSVESLYYDTMIMEKIETRQSNVSPDIADLNKAKQSIVTEVSRHKERLCALLIEKRARNAVQAALPTHESLSQNPIHCIKFDASGLLAEEEKKIDNLVSNQDTDGLINRYSVSTTGALGAAAKALGFHGRAEYESAVKKLLVDDEIVRNALRDRLSDLTQAIEKD